MNDEAVPTPRVFLVGAGPGDPGLITVRGLELLRSCDVVVYDRLVSARLVDEAPEDAERVFVGKGGGRVSPAQSEIDAEVVAHARAGRRVVRLKGGDPFVFGRGADEAQALAAAGVPFEVVPGVTSAVAVPAYAGIPLTHSGTSSSFTVMTAHESAQRPWSEERWRNAAAGSETLILLMAVAALRETAEKLIEAGRDPSEPAAVIEWGTTPRQRTLVADLATIADVAEASDIRAPAITIVGPVVRLRDAMDWFEARPLFGRRIVVTRPRHQAGELSNLLDDLGAEVIPLPTIEIFDPPSWDELDAAIDGLVAGAYEWVVFASANAVEKLWGRLAHGGHDSRALSRARIASVGSATSSALAARGVLPDLVPARSTGEALVEALGHGAGRVLLPRPAGAPDEPVAALQAAGWSPDVVAAYVTAPAAGASSEVLRVVAGDFDAVVFTSGSTVRGFTAAAGPLDEIGLGGEGKDKLVVCIGPSTAAAAEAAGLGVDVVAEEQTAPGIAAAVRRAFASR